MSYLEKPTEPLNILEEYLNGVNINYVLKSKVEL